MEVEQNQELNNYKDTQYLQKLTKEPSYSIDKQEDIQYILNSKHLQNSITSLLVKREYICGSFVLSQAIKTCANLKEFTLLTTVQIKDIEEIFLALSYCLKLKKLVIDKCIAFQDRESAQKMKEMLKLLNLDNLSVSIVGSNILDIYEIFGQAILENKNLYSIDLDLRNYIFLISGSYFMIQLEENILKKWSQIFKRKLKKLVICEVQTN